MSKLLGVYIPTMNRPRELEECLVSFIKQLKQYQFPIYISDNSLDDRTKTMVARLKRRYLQLRYKQSKPMGYADNVKNVLAMGDTEYMWLFGDDDTIKGNAIKIIVDALGKKIDYLQINSEVYSQDLKRIIKARIIQKDATELYSSRDYEQTLLNNQDTGYQGFMAQMIIRKSIVSAELKKLDIYEPNMDFLHTIMFYRGIRNKRGMLIAEPLINNRGGNWSYSKRMMGIFFKSWYKTHSMISQYYSKDTINTVVRQSLFNLLIPITINRIMTESSPSEDYKNYIAPNRYISNFNKCMILIVIHMPKGVLNVVYEAYKNLKGY